MTIESTSHVVELIAGTYTGRDSRGIYQFSYDIKTRSFGALSLLAETSNPSYGTHNTSLEVFYFVGEDNDGTVQTFKRSTDDSSLEPVNAQSSRGAHPCYLALSPDNRHLAVANYSSGNIAVFEIDADGAIQSEPTVLQHQGSGANAQRQAGPHAHWVQWNPQNTFLYAVDLGIDQVIAYPFDKQRGEIGDGFTALRTKPGAGPRHMAFHPARDLVYLFNELSNEIVVAQSVTDGNLHATQTLSSLPDGFDGSSQGGHIAINAEGTRLYSSNRGHDSISVFAIAENGHLTLLQHVSTGGHWPRFFLLLEEKNLLLVANEKSNTVVAFEVAEQGTLTRVGEPLSISQPTYLALQ